MYNVYSLFGTNAINIVNEMYEELKDNGYEVDDMSEVEEDVFNMIENWKKKET